MINETIAHYRITGKLGQGGMGEVYRATDTQLDRDVAIKVLPEAFARDEARLARFEREAKALAALHHPNIATLFGFETYQDRRFLVMELVEGQTLAERLQQGSFEVTEALDIGRQIAEALEAAHEKGIVHRDLKPANVKITPEGRIKVLDFGIAKSMSLAASDTTAFAEASTVTDSPTMAGTILGTAAYMSPEQARGRPVDKRSDIWSFACLLYECLTGQRAFAGDDNTDTLASVLRGEPVWPQLPQDTPATIQLLLRKCLIKEPRRRLRDIGDALVDLEQALADPEGTSLNLSHQTLGDVRSPSRSWSTAVMLLVGLVLGGLAVETFWQVTRSQGSAPASPRKFTFPWANLESHEYRPPILSPDGGKVLFLTASGYAIRHLDHIHPESLSTAAEFTHPFWSPDGETIGLFQGSSIWKQSLAGGNPTLFVDLGQHFQAGSRRGPHAAWIAEDRMVIATGGTGLPLLEIAAQGGEVNALLKPSSDEADLCYPATLPDGNLLLCEGHSERVNRILWTDGRQSRILLESGANIKIRRPQYAVKTGHVLYERSKSDQPEIWAFSFSLEKGERTGDPFPIVTEARFPSLARDGTLIYQPFLDPSAHTPRQIVWLDPKGKIETKPVVGDAQVALGDPRLSPDETRVAVTSEALGNKDIWIHEIGRPVAMPLTRTEYEESHPIWSPDGKQLIFRSVTADGVHLAFKTIGASKQNAIPAEFIHLDGNSDGTMLALVHNLSINLFSLKDDVLEPLTTREGTNHKEYFPRFSPDGRHLAYMSDETGNLEVWVVGCPDWSDPRIVSIDGGLLPCWSKDGKAIYYVTPKPPEKILTMHRVTVNASDDGTGYSEPKSLFTFNATLLDIYSGYDVHSDGRFLMVSTGLKEGEPPPEEQSVDPLLSNVIVVDQTWATGLKEK